MNGFEAVGKWLSDIIDNISYFWRTWQDDER